MNSETKTQLIDLIKVLNDGVEFYEKAIDSVDEGYVKGVFEDMLSKKKALKSKFVTLLSPEDSSDLNRRTLEGHLRQKYAEVASKIMSEKTQHYVEQLEEIEDNVLEALKNLNSHNTEPGLRTFIDEGLSCAQECHDRMRSLEKAEA